MQRCECCEKSKSILTGKTRCIQNKTDTIWIIILNYNINIINYKHEKEKENVNVKVMWVRNVKEK